MTGTIATDSTSIAYGRIAFRQTRLRPKSLILIGAVALTLALSASLFSSGTASLQHVYLLSVCFYLSISLGALFFVVLHHLTGARWSVATRRVAEGFTTAIPVLGLLMLPIVIPMLFGNAQLYEWNDVVLRDADELIRGKAAWLNAPFFAIRCLLYFGVWTFIARFYWKNSVSQDSSGDILLKEKMRKFSGPAMLAFGLTINFAAFDLLMSLDPHWFSTIFGLYFFSGSAMAFFAALPIVLLLLQRAGYLANLVTTEHYHDMAKLLFGFNMFWAYMAFSQYLLIWYANIPEETGWFLIRQQGGWQFIGLLLIIGHFLVPFFGLMSRRVRRDRNMLALWSVVLLVMHWFDLFWLVMPNVKIDNLAIGLQSLLCFVGVGGIWLSVMLRQATGMRLIPSGDPHLHESLAFHNA